MDFLNIVVLYVLGFTICLVLYIFGDSTFLKHGPVGKVRRVLWKVRSLVNILLFNSHSLFKKTTWVHVPLGVLAWQINQHLLTGTPVYSTFAINFENQILGWMQCYVIELLVMFT